MNKGRETGGHCRRRGVLGLWLLLAALPAAAQVGPLTSQSLFFDQASNAHSGNYLAVETGVVYTDNATLTPNGSGDTLLLLGLLADTSRQGPILDYHLDSDVTVIKYLHDDFGTEPSGYADGSADIKIVPGTFSWTGRETFNQALINPYAPATPDNVENLNNISTGPRFTLSPTLRTNVMVEGTYSYIDSSSQSPSFLNISSHRYGGDGRADYAFTNSSSVYVLGSYQKVDFVDHVDNVNYNQGQGSLGFRYGDGRTILDLSAGYSEVHTTTQSFGGGTYSFSLSRLISPRQRLAFTALQTLTDTPNSFRLSADQPVVGILPTRLGSGDPFTLREYGVNWTFQAVRTTVQVALLDYKQTYELTPLENGDSKIANALIARQISPVLNLDLGLTFQHGDYVFGATNTISETVSLRWQLGHQLGVRFIYSHSSFTPNGYVDNQIGVTCTYAFIGGAWAGSQPDAVAPLLPTSPMSMQAPLQPAVQSSLPPIPQ